MGSVRIVTSKGVTLRSGYSIDSSTTLARLPLGAVLKAYDRRLLEAPDGSCVDVWRVEVAWEGGRGWVSERGRVRGKEFGILEWVEGGDRGG